MRFIERSRIRGRRIGQRDSQTIKHLGQILLQIKGELWSKDYKSEKFLTVRIPRPCYPYCTYSLAGAAQEVLGLGSKLR